MSFIQVKFGFLITLCLAPSVVRPAVAASAITPVLPVEKAHALTEFAANGSSFADSIHIGKLGWSEEQFAAFLDGIRASYHGKSYPLDDASRRLQEETLEKIADFQARQKQQAALEFAQPGRLAAYMKQISKRFALQESDSGLAYKIETGRPGLRPGPNDTVVVSVIAFAADGTTKLPQISFERARMQMQGLMPGFVEGFQMMTLDSKATLVLPPALSFGSGEWPEGVDQGTPLIFQITLHEVISAPKAP